MNTSCRRTQRMGNEFWDTVLGIPQSIQFVCPARVKQKLWQSEGGFSMTSLIYELFRSALAPCTSVIIVVF